ncbi:MAG: alpha/beta hydrolase [Phycisphaerales bacterium]|nr:alpha/beta hydrolase [Phycisphaerales bacterium]
MPGPINLACTDQGSGPVVVLVHGFPIEGSMWRDAAGLLGAAHRVLAPDQRGYGRSPGTPAATMADYADDLARLLDRHAVDRPALLAGLSFGGYVVMEFMRRHPDRLEAVGLVDTREVGDTPDAAAGRRAGADALDAGGPVSAVVAPMLPKLFAPGAPRTMVEHWSRVLCAQSPGAVAATLRAMADRPDSTETLRAFQGRALVVAGEYDAITPVEVHERMAALLPNAELRIIPGAGHMAPTEQPRAFASIVEEFLAQDARS